jgi:regulatory protein
VSVVRPPSPDAESAPRTGPSLKGRALRLLALREHTRSELEHKLARHDPDPAELKAALDDLQAKGFISEARVVESVLHTRASRLGAQRVRRELQQKGVGAEAVAQAMARLRETEEERAREVWRRKFGTPAVDAKERAKQIRFLVSRGFAPEVVRRVTRAQDVD